MLGWLSRYSSWRFENTLTQCIGPAWPRSGNWGIFIGSSSVNGSRVVFACSDCAWSQFLSAIRKSNMTLASCIDEKSWKTTLPSSLCIVSGFINRIFDGNIPCTCTLAALSSAKTCFPPALWPWQCRRETSDSYDPGRSSYHQATCSSFEPWLVASYLGTFRTFAAASVPSASPRDKQASTKHTTVEDISYLSSQQAFTYCMYPTKRTIKYKALLNKTLMK